MFELNKKNAADFECLAMRQRHVEIEVSGMKSVIDVAPLSLIHI